MYIYIYIYQHYFIVIITVAVDICQEGFDIDYPLKAHKSFYPEQVCALVGASDIESKVVFVGGVVRWSICGYVCGWICLCVCVRRWIAAEQFATICWSRSMGRPNGPHHFYQPCLHSRILLLFTPPVSP